MGLNLIHASKKGPQVEFSQSLIHLISGVISVMWWRHDGVAPRCGYVKWWIWSSGEIGSVDGNTYLWLGIKFWWKRFSVVQYPTVISHYSDVTIWTTDDISSISRLRRDKLHSSFDKSIFIKKMHLKASSVKCRSFLIAYRQVSNIRRTLVGNKIVDHSDVVGASPVGAASTTSSFST